MAKNGVFCQDVTEFFDPGVNASAIRSCNHWVKDAIVMINSVDT